MTSISMYGSLFLSFSLTTSRNSTFVRLAAWTSPMSGRAILPSGLTRTNPLVTPFFYTTISRRSPARMRCALASLRQTFSSDEPCCAAARCGTE